MPTPEMPDDVNPPDQSSYQFVAGRTFVTEQLEGGAPRTRRDYLGADHILSCKYSCTGPQYARLWGFFREFVQSFSEEFIAPLLIDVPFVLPYRCTLLEEPRLLETEGLLYVIGVKYSVTPNPIKSFSLRIENVTTPTLRDSNTSFYSGDMSEFLVGRRVQLVGTKAVLFASGATITLDGNYAIDTAPTVNTRTLSGAATSLPGWATLNADAFQAYSPIGGAAVLLPNPLA